MSATTSQFLFEGRSVACRRSGRVVFSALDFALSPGDGLVLRGPNGSGKSTLLQIMSGLLPPIGGAIFWQGRPIAEDQEAHASNLCYIGHNDALKPLLTAEENLRFWAAFHHEGFALERMVKKGLGVFGLAPLARMPTRSLSAGQKRRLCLARLLVNKAPLWLLDEPINALDEKSLLVLEKVIVAHRAQGGIVVLSSHGDAFPTGWGKLVLSDFSASPINDPTSAWL